MPTYARSGPSGTLCSSRCVGLPFLCAFTNSSSPLQAFALAAMPFVLTEERQDSPQCPVAFEGLS